MDRGEFIKNLRLYGLKNDIPNITDLNARFLRDLIKIKWVKNMLEIGTANGFSAIQFGFELEKTGWKLMTIDFSEKSYLEATDNIKEIGLDDIITLVYGNALHEIPKLWEVFDFVFIDGMKRRTVDFLDGVWNSVEEKGIIIIDDVIKFGDKMVWLYEYLDKNNIIFHVIPIDGDDGIMMIVK
jgi:predicted O-methyltransferase YrrM